MPSLSNESLLRVLGAPLPPQALVGDQAKPVRASIPGVGDFRIYLFTCTPDRSAAGRPAGEYKIQLILRGQAKGARGSLDTSGVPTALLGYCPDLGVFVAWEARCYESFGYSRNVQVGDALLEEARTYGWAVDEPWRDDEVRVAFKPSRLLRFLEVSAYADRHDYRGSRRRLFFLCSVRPNTGLEPPVSGGEADLEELAVKQRETNLRAVLQRDPRFAPQVREQYDQSCAICGVQLGIIHAAHIIPVSHEDSSDNIWNGLALCPNHHAIYDAHILSIDPDLRIRVGHDRLDFLRDTRRGQGLQDVANMNRQVIRAPHDWSETNFRARMRQALDVNLGLSGLA